ncbi:hypothetical protein BDN70DRAFT_291570 [Pholiota conissans]|uniref:Uncharacterized protein n=1 Tax=Pholiota conissans TaxID=109636 RepID=A0A9P5Z9U8_9AGAR|nr:hypothetical protein BDN70DRAFT_291570 [Pholiota conissans]
MGFTNGAKFDLNVSGIAGFFGGDESIAAMASVNLIRYRWLLGWYNSPGNYFVSRKYGIIAGNRVWDGLFPGKDYTPATILGLDGQFGPRFLGAKMGTSIDMTGHLAYLLFSHRKDPDAFDPLHHNQNVGLRDSSSPPSTTVSVSAINPQQTSRYSYSVTMVSMDDSFIDNAKLTPETDDFVMDEFLKPMRVMSFIAAFLTIGFSVGSAVVAAVVWHDYFCCIAISIGIICNGFACLIYGSATLRLFSPRILYLDPSKPIPGDGILVRENDIVVLRGPESKIGTIKRGCYELVYPEKAPYHRVGFMSILLVFQAFAQIAIIPVATLRGQIIFLATFALSWLYNGYLASVDREKLQFGALSNVLGLSMPETVNFSTWSAAVAASTFLLCPSCPEDWLRQLIPNNVPVWIKWRECMVKAIECRTQGGEPTFDLPPGVDKWGTDDKKRLEFQLQNAKVGYDWYCRYLQGDKMYCKHG